MTMTANAFAVKGLFNRICITSVCMEPLKKTRKLPLLPVLAGLMILLPILFVAGCTGNAPGPSGLHLNGTGWTLTEYVSGGRSVQTLNGTTITMVFGGEGRITGSAGCNHYFASYDTKGTTITIGQAGSTLMYCTGEGVMEQESAYLALLNKAASVSSVNDRLTLADAQGRTILSFVRIVMPDPEPLVGTTWTLDSLYTADAVSSVLAGTNITAVFGEDGRVSGSAGCNNYFGSYTVTDSSLLISSVGSTKMNCPGTGIMQQENNFLESLGRTAKFTISGNRLSLEDLHGATLLTFTRES